MALLDTMVIIPMDTGSGEDIAVNTFHFATTLPDASDVLILNDIQIALGNCVQGYLAYCAADVKPTDVRWKVYDASAPTPRAPIRDVILKAGMTTGVSSLPHELAVCASFQGSRISGVPQARRRGRIYIGPLSASAMNGAVPATAFLTAINTAMKGLADAGNPTANWTWCVFSRRGIAPPAPPNAVEIIDGWTDNAFDTQRRRGVRATTKTAWVSST